jgi:hypothetical protein
MAKQHHACLVHHASSFLSQLFGIVKALVTPDVFYNVIVTFLLTFGLAGLLF